MTTTATFEEGVARVEAQHAKHRARRAEIETAESNLEKARATRNRVTRPDSIIRANGVIAEKHAELQAIRARHFEEDVHELMELDAETLGKRLVTAADYSYEATMGDYSIGSIQSAARDLLAVKEALKVKFFWTDEFMAAHIEGARAERRAAQEKARISRVGFEPKTPTLAEAVTADAKATFPGLTFGTSVYGNRTVKITDEGVSMSLEAFQALIASTK